MPRVPAVRPFDVRARDVLSGVSFAALLAIASPAIAASPAQGGSPSAAAGPTGAPVQVAARPGRSSMEEIVVTASPIGQRRENLLQGSSILSGAALDRAQGTTLGQALARLPGVSQTGFGQGASRPVIRGLGGDRIRVLIGGIGTIDASTTSPDHAPAVDLATARKVEVVRGAATLLYGNNAVGGVVNVLDGRIPTAVPKDGVEGTARLGYGHNAGERSGAATLDVVIADGLVGHVDGYWRDTDDFDVPGFLRSARLRALEAPDPVHGEARGRVENSDVAQKGGTLGVSLLRDWGFFGASVSRQASDYGIAGHDHEHVDEPGAGVVEEHEDVRIDLEQTRFDLMGEINRSFLAFETVRVRFGHADYDHAEIEGAEIGTIFANKGWEGRIEFVQQATSVLGGTLGGALGVQFSDRDFSAVGAEAFVPPSNTFQGGAFLFQRLDLGNLSVEGGARIEGQTVEAESRRIARDFTGVSVSAGLGYKLGGGWQAGLNLARTERAPNAEELLSDGPHLATRTYEVGDPDLDKEVAWSGEVSLKYVDDADYAAVNLYATRYRDFIYDRFTGEEEDDLPVAVYTAAAARFVGFEVEAGTERPLGPGVLQIEGFVDHVRARDTTNGHPVPRMPPLSARATVGYELPQVAGRIEAVWADDQTRHGPFDLPTDGYTVLNASVDWTPVAARDLTLLLEVRNLTDEEVRLSTSALKDRLPQPGRDYRISLRAAF